MTERSTYRMEGALFGGVSMVRGLNVSRKSGIAAYGTAVIMLAAVFCLSMAPDVAWGGESTLRGFETDLKPKKQEYSADDSHDGHHGGGGHRGGRRHSGGLFGILLDVVFDSGDSSEDASSDLAADTPVSAPPPEPVAKTAVVVPEEKPPAQPYVWQPGSGFTPRFRVDYGQMWVSSHIGATMLSVEGGDDRMGVLVRDTQFVERDPRATLRVRDYNVLFRLVMKEDAELDLGGGGTEIDGEDENSGIAYVGRVRLKSQEGWVFEGRYSGASINGNDVSDGEIAASLEQPYVALKGGYRWLKSPSMLLDGPFVGISVRY